MHTSSPDRTPEKEHKAPLEGLTNSFIVKIWLDEALKPTARWIWRGHITHVPSHQRMYFQSLNAIPMFIANILQQSGAEVSMYWRIRLMMNELPKYFSGRAEKDQE